MHEGDTITITGTLDGIVAGVNFITQRINPGGTAQEGQDYTSSASGGRQTIRPFIFFATQLSETTTIIVTDGPSDGGTESDETITLAFTENPGSSTTDTVTITPATITITILGNDGQEFSIAAGSATAAEDVGNITFTVTMIGERLASGNRTVEWAVTGVDTANDLMNYPASRTLTFSQPGTQDITIAVNDDSDSEGDETLTVTLSNPSGGATLGTATASTTITDNDAVRTLTVTGPAGGTITEGAAGSFSIGITGTEFRTPAAVTVTWTITHAQTGGTDDADFGGMAGLTGSVTFPTQTSFTITPADDNLDEDAEAFTVQVSVADPTADMGTAFGTAASVSITDNDTVTVTLTGPAALGEEETATYTVNLGAIPMAAVTVEYSITGSGVPIASGQTLPITPPETTATLTLTTDDGGGRGTPDRTFTITITDVSGGATPTERPTLTVTISEDDPAARAARVKAPLAAFAKGAGQLAAQAVSQRLHFTGNALTPDSFALSLKDAGFNLWAGGSRLSANGNDNGLAYDGHTTAWHLGADTPWRDGLLGIAVGQSAGDTDFSNADAAGKLKSNLFSVHPYVTRKLPQADVWATAGIGDGEAELREAGEAGFTTDLTVLTAGVGATVAAMESATLSLGAVWSRAELDASTNADGKTLPAVTADALRLNAGLEAGWDLTEQWRPFLTVNIRSDSGDGDDGNAADYGGGVEWQSRTLHMRLEGRKHAQGKGPDEEHLTLTARKTAGRLNLGLNLTADHGLNTANLLTGELRF